MGIPKGAAIARGIPAWGCLITKKFKERIKKTYDVIVLDTSAVGLDPGNLI